MSVRHVPQRTVALCVARCGATVPTTMIPHSTPEATVMMCVARCGATVPTTMIPHTSTHTHPRRPNGRARRRVTRAAFGSERTMAVVVVVVVVRRPLAHDALLQPQVGEAHPQRRLGAEHTERRQPRALERGADLEPRV